MGLGRERGRKAKGEIGGGTHTHTHTSHIQGWVRGGREGERWEKEGEKGR